MSRYKITLTEEEAQALLNLGDKIKEAGASLKQFAKHMDSVRAEVLEAINRHEESVKNDPEMDEMAVIDYIDSLPRNTIEDDSYYKLAVARWEEGCCPKCWEPLIAGGDHYDCNNCGIMWREE